VRNGKIEQHMAMDQTDQDNEPRRKGGGPFRFFGEVRAEARKVTWATRQEVTVSTIMVVIFGITAAIFSTSSIFAAPLLQFISASVWVVETMVEEQQQTAAPCRAMPARRAGTSCAYSNFEAKVAEAIRDQAGRQGLRSVRRHSGSD
jgi:preprotein translocase subunit SecE